MRKGSDLPVIESVRWAMLFNLIVLELDLIIYNIRTSSSFGIESITTGKRKYRHRQLNPQNYFMISTCV